MPRPARSDSIDAIVQDAATRVVSRLSLVISRRVADLVQEGVRRELGAAGARRGGGRRAGARAELTRWVADSRARRVPNFVIGATGLDTKKKIVAKYGPGAAFEKGRPLPRPKG